MMNTKQKEVIETFRNNYNCAQSVLSVFANDMGLSKNAALKLANPFGAGIVYMQQTCGAVTGALMTIGLRYGRGENGTAEDKEMANDMARHFITEFEKCNGTTKCFKLLDEINLSTPDGMKYALDNEVFRTKCEKYLLDAVRITEQIVNR